MALTIGCIVLICLKPNRRIILATSFALLMIFIFTPIIASLARIEKLPVSFEYVIHAGGGMDDTPYMNCQEGFLQNV